MLRYNRIVRAYGRNQTIWKQLDQYNGMKRQLNRAQYQYHVSPTSQSIIETKNQSIIKIKSENNVWNPNSSQLMKMEKLTNRILHEVSIGALTLKDLTAIRSAMAFYTREVRSLNTTKPRLTFSSPEIFLTQKYTQAVEQLLERVLLEEHRQRKAVGGKGTIRADKVMYQYVLDVLATSSLPHKAEQWLQKLDEASLWKQKRHLKPDVVAYNACILAWARCDGVAESGIRAEALLRAMKDRKLQPTTITYNRVIAAWGRSGGKEKAAIAAELILEEMLTRQSGIPSPDRNTWHSVMEAWSWSEVPSSPDRVEDLICRMIEYSAVVPIDIGDYEIDPYNEEIKPDLTTYHILLTSFAKSGRRNLVAKAEQIFDRILSGDLEIIPNTITFTIIMEVLAKHGAKGSASKVHDILNRMLNYSKSNDDVKPNTFTFNVAIDAYSKSGKRDASNIAEELLLQLEKLYEEQRDEHSKPNVVSYTSTLDAIANTAAKDSIERAQRIYKRVEERINDGDKEFSASVIVHSSMIKVLAKSGQYRAGEKALDILKKLYQRSRSTSSDQGFRLSRSIFNTVIDALKNDKASSVHDVEWVIDWMKKLNEDGIIDFGPDEISYTSLIVAWGKSGLPNAIDRVEEILKMMEDSSAISPTIVTYAAVINAFARSNAVDAPQRAEKLINRLELIQGDHTNRVEINAVCYTSMIKTWASSMRHQGEMALEKIDGILQNMWNLHESMQASTKPTLVTYGAVINSLAKSSNPRKATIAYKYLGDVISRYSKGDTDLKPNIFLFNAVLWVCATTKGPLVERKRALDIALETFNETKAYASPDSYTYSTLLLSYSNLSEENNDRYNQGSRIFEECCEKGRVDYHVLKQLRLCLSRAGFANLLKDVINIKDTTEEEIVRSLPQKWTRNAIKQSRNISNSRHALRRGRAEGRRLRQESLGSGKETRERRAIR